MSKKIVLGFLRLSRYGFFQIFGKGEQQNNFARFFNIL